MNWEDLRTTPEEIVDRLGSIANRQDIRDTKEIQVREIREYAAKELDRVAEGIIDMANLDETDKVQDYLLRTLAHTIHGRANDIREGR